MKKMKWYMTTKSGKKIRFPKIICDLLCEIKFPLFNGAYGTNE